MYSSVHSNSFPLSQSWAQSALWEMDKTEIPIQIQYTRCLLGGQFQYLWNLDIRLRTGVTNSMGRETASRWLQSNLWFRSPEQQIHLPRSKGNTEAGVGGRLGPLYISGKVLQLQIRENAGYKIQWETHIYTTQVGELKEAVSGNFRTNRHLVFPADFGKDSSLSHRAIEENSMHKVYLVLTA